MAKRIKSASALPELIIEAQSFCGANGLVMVSNVHTDGSLVHAPVTLLPYALPRTSFAKAQALSVPFNHLVDACSRDDAFLRQCLAQTANGDAFTARLLRVYDKHGGPRAKQQVQLGLHRSDYMLDSSTGRLLQIELNTIASSFGCLSTRVTRLHQHLLGHKLHLAKQVDDEGHLAAGSLPPNSAEQDLSCAIAAAHTEYLRQVDDSAAAAAAALAAVVVFVCQEGERNYVDQRHLEYELANAHGVSVVRLTLAEVLARTQLDEATSRLYLLHGEGEEERLVHVSVVYFRAGYTPTDYPGEAQWEARERIERSLAIKCPSIGYHLVGAKKVQQELARPGVLERFLGADGANSVELVRSCFAGLWSLNTTVVAADGQPPSELDDAVREHVLLNPHRYVVKPQREGGGNNLYGAEVKRALEEMPPHELSAHILMERIFPPAHMSHLMRHGEVTSGQAVCELGVYSTYLGDGQGRVLVNQSAGHLLRTKFEGVDEGGVATGFSALSSPWLVD